MEMSLTRGCGSLYTSSLSSCTVLQIGFASISYTAEESSTTAQLLIISNGVNEGTIQVQLDSFTGTATGKHAGTIA